jgi:hypothetical protein
MATPTTPAPVAASPQFPPPPASFQSVPSAPSTLLPYAGKKRGPKSKAEKEALAASGQGIAPQGAPAAPSPNSASYTVRGLEPSFVEAIKLLGGQQYMVGLLVADLKRRGVVYTTVDLTQIGGKSE